MSFKAKRYHDISCGHRVVGHENKCAHLHGHNYRFHFTCIAEDLDSVGRVVDFSVIKSQLCQWLEDNWDHKFLAWENDSMLKALSLERNEYSSGVFYSNDAVLFSESFVFVPFNPTAENMAQYMVEVVGPEQLAGTGAKLVSCTVEETAKCSASFSM